MNPFEPWLTRDKVDRVSVGPVKNPSWEMFHWAFLNCSCVLLSPKPHGIEKSGAWMSKVWGGGGVQCSPLLVSLGTSRCTKITYIIQGMVLLTTEVELTPCTHSRISLNIQVCFLGEQCHFMFIPDFSDCFTAGGEISCKKSTTSKEKVGIGKY